MAKKVKIYNPANDSYKTVSQEFADKLIKYQERVNSKTKVKIVENEKPRKQAETSSNEESPKSDS